jgi:hypothetical protein
MKLKHVVALTSAVMLLAGCISYESVVEPGAHFSPLGSNQGVQVGLIRIFFVHGIGTHDPNYAGDFITGVANKFNLKAYPEDGLSDIPVDDSKGYSNLRQFPRPATLRIYRFRDAERRIRLVGYALDWEVLTSGPGSIKETVLGADEKVPRAHFNRELKQGLDPQGTTGLMDDNLADVVLYVDHYHKDVIHRATVNALGIFMARTYDGQVPPGETVEVDFVTHSLGGIILSDALGAYWGHSATKHATTGRGPSMGKNAFGTPVENSEAAVDANDSTGNRFDNVVAQTKHIYMFANQIPFLAMARMDTIPLTDAAVGGESASGGSDSSPEEGAPRLQNLGKYFTPLPHTGGETRKAKIIAFSDPNDLLTWQIHNENSTGDPIEIVNVRLLNGSDHLGILESPKVAHDGYWTNHKVLNYILTGISRS